MDNLAFTLLKMIVILLISMLIVYLFTSFALWELAVVSWPISARVIAIILVLGLYADVSSK